MITKINSREIVYIYGYIEPTRKLTSLLLKEIKHITSGSGYRQACERIVIYEQVFL